MLSEILQLLCILWVQHFPMVGSHNWANPSLQSPHAIFHWPQGQWSSHLEDSSSEWLTQKSLEIPLPPLDQQRWTILSCNWMGNVGFSKSYLFPLYAGNVMGATIAAPLPTFHSHWFLDTFPFSGSVLICSATAHKDARLQWFVNGNGGFISVVAITHFGTTW